MNSFALFSAEAWGKNDVEAVEYSGEIWTNSKHYEKNLILQIADRTQDLKE